MAKTWIYAASAAAIGGALIGGWLLDPAPPEAPPQARQSPAAQAVAAPAAALAAPTADATHMLAPAPVAAPAPRERVTLWQGELRSREGAQGIPEYLAQVEPALLDTLALGQVLEMSLPGRERPLRARLASTHNSAGLPVWRGGLVDGDEAESLTVVRGSLETHINVATLDGSYSIIVDNRSGKTRVIDENDIAARSDPHGDHVDAPLAELPPMPPPAQG
ncbi:biofilm-associated metzincin protease inhibitor BamI [Pseudomonas aeruginosa]|uniref:biofilm-associated metzincin protease inhibitor BamI n=1 Tax=Pseudomonas aeruginosa TaxID=287 RepID=UPI00070F2C0C|nr:biofilm-associated metzincin protease inhibitor BamI [Pseudomonas aeruginosa]